MAARVGASASAPQEAARLRTENNALRMEFTRMSLRLHENQAVLKEYTALRGEKEALEQALQRAQQNMLEYAQMAAAVLSENASLRVENERLLSSAAAAPSSQQQQQQSSQQQQQQQQQMAAQVKQLQALLAQAAEREQSFAREREQAAAAAAAAAAESERLGTQVAATQLQLQDAQAKAQGAEKAAADAAALRRELEEQKARAENLERANRAIKEKVERLVATLKTKGWSPTAAAAAGVSPPATSPH